MTSHVNFFSYKGVTPYLKFIPPPTTPPLSFSVSLGSPMAACSSYSKKKRNSVSSSKQPNYLYSSHRYDHFQHVILSGDTDIFDFELELEESDVFWGSNVDDCPGNVPSSKYISRSATLMIPPAVTSNASGRKKKPVSASLPVNVPDWSRVGQLWEGDDDAGEEGEGGGGDGTIMAEKVPPHEYLARRRGESSSVRKGTGRTLKGMELCRFRNEILKKLVGFED